MKVQRDFEALYASEADPWKIGDADSDRYDLYYDIVTTHVVAHGRILDIGSGFGAFLARFRQDFDALTAVELSENAVSKGKRRFPFIHFLNAPAEEVEQTVKGEFDAILVSDVICYLGEEQKIRLVRWVADHLSRDGITLIAGWSPGGDYPNHDEMRWLVERDLAIQTEGRLQTGHSYFLARRRRRLAAVTVDYETWHPIPEEGRIDWQVDVLGPASHLLDISDAEGVRLTLMAELGEYFWLLRFDPEVASKMEMQWRDALARGHDVQLHLHPNWLPELGARYQDGRWTWDWSRPKADDYPGDLAELVSRCRTTLEGILREVDPAYRVSCFRAGAYRAQPFRRLHAALVANEIFCDSSVYAGGVSEERGYDYSLAYSNHQPYFAAAFDPQLKASPAESRIVELPIFTFRPGERWLLDGEEGPRIADRLLRYLRDASGAPRTCQDFRRRKRRIELGRRVLDRLVTNPLVPQRLLPRALVHSLTPYAPERLVGDEYFVLIGHTKGPKHFEAIAENFRRLRREGRLEFVTLSTMARLARDDLARSVRSTATEEAAFQVQRAAPAILGEERNERQAHFLQERIPLDRAHLLDLGCGAGYRSERIARRYPWMAVQGIDCGREFIAKASSRYSADVDGFTVGEFEALPYRSASFDCIYADNVLEHAFDVDRVLAELYRTLSPGGVLIAAIPSDARNPKAICDNHTWKTAPDDVRLRLEAAGFVNLEIGEVDCWYELGERPYPPSLDLLMHVRAWKRELSISRLERALEAMDWVYRHLSPERASEGNDAVEILASGHAWCWGYAVVLGKVLEREGFSPTWVSMIARDHERGRGEDRTDSHEVLEVEIDGHKVLLDPMSNTLIQHSLAEVLEEPSLAVPKTDADERYRRRRYDLYSTEYWYRRVSKYTRRRSPDRRVLFWRTNATRK